MYDLQGTLLNVAKIPGNVLAGNWRVAMLVDASASDEQLEAIVDAYSGKLGGPLADLAVSWARAAASGRGRA